MSTTSYTTIEWDALFMAAKDYLTAFANQHWPLESDGSGAPARISLHRLFEAFPVPTDIVLLDLSGIDLPRKQGRYATAFRYDFSRPSTAAVHYHGVISLTHADAHTQLLESALGIDEEPLRSLKDLTLTCIWGTPYLTHITLYDPRTRISDYCDDLAHHLSHPAWGLSDLFSPTIDYNAKYDLPPDPTLTDEQLLQIHELTAYFIKTSDGKPASLAERHQSVASIQLIPQVPESVKLTFHRAKRLYVYGYLEYGFFTVSSHYAHLALDAALHARWTATLPASVVLTWHNKKTGKVEQYTMLSPSHTKIREFCKRSGWRVSAVKVDGKPFPYTVNLVIAELANIKAITIWQQKMIQEVDVEIRNTLTHVEFAPVYSPSPHDLAITAETINGLFDSLPMSPGAPSP